MEKFPFLRKIFHHFSLAEMFPAAVILLSKKMRVTIFR